MTVQEKRINKLRDILEDNTQAALISNENDMYYFTGMQRSEGKVLVTKDEAYFFVDFRYIEAAKNIVSSCKVILFSTFSEEACKILKTHGIKTLYIQSEYVAVNTLGKYIRDFNSVGTSVVSDEKLDKAVLDLRIIKSEDEVQLLDKAQKITEKAYNEILNYIKPGVSERTISVELEYLMKKYGASHVSFDLITITGKNTSLPHGVPGDTLIKEGDFFTMDIGALYQGYHSDMTRTVAVGSCSDEQREIYDIVLKAQLTALNAVKAGKKASDIDKTARDIITQAGYGKNFGHSTGHGVGLDIHEAPYVSTRSDAVLAENMVITVEPGI